MPPISRSWRWSRRTTSSRRPGRSAIAEPGRDLDLVRLYWPTELRPAFDALMAIDAAMGDVVASTSQPALGAIRLAWWREALERLDSAPPPDEPRLQAVAAELLPRGLAGSEVAVLEDGWSTLLDEEPDFRRVARRGQRLFALGARLLRQDPSSVEAAGRLYAAIDAARRGVFDLRNSSGLSLPPAVRTVRPLTALAALAARDQRRGPPFEVEATPGRAWTLLRHRFTGRF